MKIRAKVNEIRLCPRLHSSRKIPYVFRNFIGQTLSYLSSAGSKDYAVKVWNTSLNQCPLVTSFCGEFSASFYLYDDDLSASLIF